MAAWLKRLHVQKKCGGLVSITGAALVLFLSAPQALTEDEPAAKAPLPPPLQGATAEAGERRMPDPAPGGDQPRPPAGKFHPTKSQLRQGKPRLQSAPHSSTVIVEKRKTSKRRGSHSIEARSSPQSHRTLAFGKTQKRDRGLAEPGVGRLILPSDYPEARNESTMNPSTEPQQSPPLYYPNYYAGPPVYGYAPSYPYAWAPPVPGILR